MPVLGGTEEANINGSVDVQNPVLHMHMMLWYSRMRDTTSGSWEASFHQPHSFHHTSAKVLLACPFMSPNHRGTTHSLRPVEGRTVI